MLESEKEILSQILGELKKLNRNLERINFKELYPPQPSALDPDQVRYEDTRLLEAHNTMSEPDYIVFHADIMAGRLECIGNYKSADRIRKLARTKATKLHRQAAEE